MIRSLASPERLWRLLMTGLCFVLFGLGGLLLSQVWFNLLLLCVRNRYTRRRLARRSISVSFRVFLTIARTVGALDYRIYNARTLREEQGCLIVANHPTLLDYVLLASVMPETDCLVKSSLLKNPFLSGVIRAADYLINSEADALLSQSQTRLAHGDTIMIFPEGTRTRPGEKMTLHRGAAHIAVRCHCDIRTVAIRCSEHLLDKQSKWYHVPPTRPLFEATPGERVQIDHFCDVNEQEPARAARQLTRHLLLKLQSVESTFSGLNDASALS
ncbi:1-acyl-sn-glycerol-3-phosphate acyltransferase [Trabulsiella guamensis ATCC 49490]|uniref:1-acyl-sn-glycerol-3-phosphate acyltransferase n=2 Tax=Trabulsiella guamensis TaxID=158852 RepID=A0A084ZPB9_9ENTR|nr:1-acyl-sn-glycerol-3-phosphate acyltransferase [Trabulsiella guamensis ATCC 49490]